MMGGPLGAVVGAAVGHNIDQGARKKNTPRESVGHQEHIQSAFITTTFQVMGHFAKADGRISEQEIIAAQAIMDHLQLNTEQRRIAIDAFTAGKQPDFAVDPALDTFQRVCRGRVVPVQRLLELQLHIIYADGSLHPHTHSRLLHVAERLGIHRFQFEALHTLFRAQRWAQQQHQNGYGSAGNNQQHDQWTHSHRPATAVNSLDHAYSVLGARHDASNDEIKLAYRRLLKRHHPDKLVASGISPTEMARATEKTRELTAAYERIRETRGF